MLPFQALLALLAFLMMVGCSQKPPLRPGLKNATQTLDNKKGPLIKPADPTTGGSTKPLSVVNRRTDISIEADGKWILSFDGDEAKKLFDAMAIAEVGGKKTGLQFECLHSDEAYRCTVLIGAADGSVKNLISNEQLVKAEPTLKPGDPKKETYTYISFSEYSTKDENGNPVTNPFAMIQFGGNSLKESTNFAGKVFENMSKPVKEMPRPTGDDLHVEGIRRIGQNVDCNMHPKKSDSKDKDFWCVLYLNTATGFISTISLPK